MTAEVWVVRGPASTAGGARVVVAFESKKDADAFAAETLHASVTKAALIAAGAEQPRWEWWSKVRLKVWGREVVSPNPDVTRVRGCLRLGSRYLHEAYLSEYVTDNDDPALTLRPATVEALSPTEADALDHAQRHAAQIINRAEAKRG